MHDIGINAENFNPRILFIFKKRFTIENNVAAHSHDFISLIYILSGACTYKINDTLYQVKKGDMLICDPGAAHEKFLDEGNEITECQVGFNNICIKNLTKNRLLGENECPVISMPKYDQEFFKCCNEIILEQEKNEPALDLIVKSLVMKLIALILKARCDETSYDADTSRENNSIEPYDKVSIVNTIVSFINHNYMKDISLDKISKNTYLSPVYVSKIFKEETGDSPINYLIKIRLSKAREILSDEHIPIKSVAKSVGYHDAYYFSKLFKKYYGYPPSKLFK